MKSSRVILILDDEVIGALGLKVQLEAAGFTEVYMAANYNRAMEIYRLQKPDTAIVDINLQSDKSGIDFVKDAREIDHVIILTGYEERLYKEQLDSVRYEHFLEKPVEADMVLRALD